MGSEVQTLISVAGIVASGLSAYVGVRVALAEVKGELKRLDNDVTGLTDRIDRLESPYFDKRVP